MKTSKGEAVYFTAYDALGDVTAHLPRFIDPSLVALTQGRDT